MNRLSAQKRAVLRAVGEENRALAAVADTGPCGGSPSRHSHALRRSALDVHLVRQAGRHLAIPVLIAGVLVGSAAVTGTTAHRSDPPPTAQSRSDQDHPARVVSIPLPEPIATPWATIFPAEHALAPLPSFQDGTSAPEAALGLASPHAPDPASGDGSSTPADALPIIRLFGLNVRTIVVDAGHGGTDPGAVGASGTREKDVTLDVARRLAARLQRGGRYRVVLTRAGDETLSLAQRVEHANAANADLFVSIHVNALPNRQVNAIETYYFDVSEDPEALRLAAIENKDSGMPVGYFRTLLESIGDTVKLQESKALAQHIQTSMINNVRNHSTKVFDSGVKVAPFVVLMGVGVPAVLVEISCISNRDEERKLRMADYREHIASFLEEGITRYLDHRQLQAQGPAHHEREDAGETADHRRQGG